MRRAYQLIVAEKADPSLWKWLEGELGNCFWPGWTCVRSVGQWEGDTEPSRVYTFLATGDVEMVRLHARRFAQHLGENSVVLIVMGEGHVI